MVDSQVAGRTITLRALMGLGVLGEIAIDGGAKSQSVGTVDRWDILGNEPQRVIRVLTARAVSYGRLSPLIGRT
jgi:hypothetical protein